eukprot:g3021.t1
MVAALASVCSDVDTALATLFGEIQTFQCTDTKVEILTLIPEMYERYALGQSQKWSTICERAKAVVNFLDRNLGNTNVDGVRLVRCLKMWVSCRGSSNSDYVAMWPKFMIRSKLLGRAITCVRNTRRDDQVSSSLLLECAELIAEIVALLSLPRVESAEGARSFLANLATSLLPDVTAALSSSSLSMGQMDCDEDADEEETRLLARCRVVVAFAEHHWETMMRQRSSSSSSLLLRASMVVSTHRSSRVSIQMMNFWFDCLARPTAIGTTIDQLRTVLDILCPALARHCIVDDATTALVERGALSSYPWASLAVSSLRRSLDGDDVAIEYRALARDLALCAAAGGEGDAMTSALLRSMYAVAVKSLRGDAKTRRYDVFESCIEMLRGVFEHVVDGIFDDVDDESDHLEIRHDAGNVLRWLAEKLPSLSSSIPLLARCSVAKLLSETVSFMSRFESAALVAATRWVLDMLREIPTCASLTVALLRCAHALVPQLPSAEIKGLRRQIASIATASSGLLDAAFERIVHARSDASLAQRREQMRLLAESSSSRSHLVEAHAVAVSSDDTDDVVVRELFERDIVALRRGANAAAHHGRNGDLPEYVALYMCDRLSAVSRATNRACEGGGDTLAVAITRAVGPVVLTIARNCGGMSDILAASICEALGCFIRACTPSDSSSSSSAAEALLCAAIEVSEHRVLAWGQAEAATCLAHLLRDTPRGCIGVESSAERLLRVVLTRLLRRVDGCDSTGELVRFGGGLFRLLNESLRLFPRVLSDVPDAIEAGRRLALLYCSPTKRIRSTPRGRVQAKRFLRESQARVRTS